MKNNWLLAFCILFLFLSIGGCVSLDNLLLSDQQKQFKAEGRNIQTGLFDEPYSGKSFREKTELESFMQTLEYNEAVANYTRWKNTYDREQSRIDVENQKIRSRNQVAMNDMERRAHNWITAVKMDGLERRIYSPSSLFEERYTRPSSQMTATLLVNNVVYATNTFYCQIEPELKNQIGGYNPRVKY